MEIMFSWRISRCVSVCNVLIDWKIVKWLDKRPFCGMRVWRSC
nr:MAG TPA: Connector enhancer of kinase suppressor of ras [Caudoviricetes sp.]